MVELNLDGGYFRLHRRLIKNLDLEMKSHPKDYSDHAEDFLVDYYHLNKAKIPPSKHHGKLARLHVDQNRTKDHLSSLHSSSILPT